ncbi:hypothetical protein [Streptomyces sp. Wb2n-11]|uniref:hypothetical protein n=1 Tax=Streptomyces sp. Wb2n-11 TaxID=1030533 RepID=UPI000B1540DA|nr:hypothetical protein [Streptomyces sp. Wb2n-11]
MSEESVSKLNPAEATPDRLLHTGATDDVTPEDLVLSSGRDVTPETLEWARRRLEKEGRSALDIQLP